MRAALMPCHHFLSSQVASVIYMATWWRLSMHKV